MLFAILEKIFSSHTSHDPTAFLGGFLKTLRKFVNTLVLYSVQLTRVCLKIDQYGLGGIKKTLPLSASKWLT